MSNAIELFIIGITVSFGPCLAICSPVILPYIAATRRGWRQGLAAILIFSFSRLVSYSVLGLLAGLFGGLISIWLRQFDYVIFLIGGMFVSLLGILIIFGKTYQSHLCQKNSNHNFTGKGIKGPIMLGLFAGILPCLPLLAVLSYIALRAADLWQGAFYGMAFGSGKIISPLIPLGVLASILPAKLIKKHKLFTFFSRICGVILLIIGINLIIYQFTVL